MITLIAVAIGCGGDAARPDRPALPGDQRDRSIEENRSAIRLEERDIDLYERRYGYTTTATGRGVRIAMVRDVDGANARNDQWATINYRVELLNGDTAYATGPGKPESFLIGMDDVESGLHEGVQFLSPGDSAVLIIPSYRAHGLLGDSDKIPMRSTVIYHIGLVKVSDRR